MFANAQLRRSRRSIGIFILMMVIHRTALSQVDTSGKGQLGHFISLATLARRKCG